MIQREIARVAAKGAVSLSYGALVPMVVTRFDAEQSRADGVRGSRAVLAALHRVVHEVVAGQTLRARLRAAATPRAAAQSIVVHASSIPSGERQALLDLYTDTNGAGWTTNTGWNGAVGTECNWYGVTCDSGGTTVQQLALYGNNLSGPFPATFGNLTNLQYLDLDTNQLTGSIPTLFLNFTNLQYLDLDTNLLTGSIPTELGALMNLQVLDLDTNQLTGSIPTAFGSLVNLTYLHVGTNQLTGSIPTGLGNLASLEYLDFDTNQLTGSIPTQLGSLTNLEYLYFYENQLSGPIPDLSNLVNLFDLDLDTNQLSGPIPDLSNLAANLSVLYLYGNLLTGSIPASLGSLVNLDDLDLDTNQLSGPIPTQLGGLASLEYLTLWGNVLSGAIPTSLENLTLLAADESDLTYNALYSTDATLTTFLDTVQYLGDWQSTQTIAPTGVAVGAITSASVALSWTPIAYTGDTGGYEVFYATSSGGPYTLSGTTADKTVAGWTVTGLAAGTPYYFVVQSVTYPNENNQNTVTSGPSAEVGATTSGTGCAAPSITSQPQGRSIPSGQAATLSVAASGNDPLSYQWYQGASGNTSLPVGTNASSFTTPVLTTTTSYWVRVSNSCGHADSLAATVVVGVTYSNSVWVPVASLVGGLNLSQWRSDLGLLNPGAATANVEIEFYGSGGMVSSTASVAGGAESILTDVVDQLGASGSGALEILSDQPLKVTARTYNQVSSTASCYPDGTQGQDYPALVTGGGLSAGQSAYLAGLTEDSSYRSNIGAVNTGTGAASVLVKLYNGAGTYLADYTVPLTAGQWVQTTQPFKNDASQTAMSAGYATVTVQSGSGVFAFASVIDNITNDPTTVAMQESAPALVVWVPVASFAGGLNQSQWRSDLGLLNPGTVTATVQIGFYGSSTANMTTSVAAGAQSILTDVVYGLGGSGSGPLEITSDQPLLVTARTYNQVSSTASCYPDGTQGQDYPAAAASSGLNSGQSAYLAGLTEDSSYRTNIGVVNTGTGVASVLVSLFDGAGTQLAEYTVPLTARQWVQTTQPFKNSAGQTALSAGYATITVQSGSGVFAFASVIDNITNDPTTVAMQR